MALAVSPAFPDRFEMLTTMAPSKVVAARGTGSLREVVAVAGFLKVQPGDACAEAALGPLGPWCQRHGIIADASWTETGTDGFSGIPAHLHAAIPVGVRLPDRVTHMATATGGSPVPVIAVGRFPAGSTCRGSPRECEDGFVIDRITWADGDRVGLTPLAEPRLTSSDRRANPFMSALGDAQVPLLAVLAWPRTIGFVDPSASAAAALGEPAEPVWYVRVLDVVSLGAPSPGIPPSVRWMLLDEPRMRVIAMGTPSAPPDGPVPQAPG